MIYRAYRQYCTGVQPSTRSQSDSIIQLDLRLTLHILRVSFIVLRTPSLEGPLHLVYNGICTHDWRCIAPIINRDTPGHSIDLFWKRHIALGLGALYQRPPRTYENALGVRSTIIEASWAILVYYSQPILVSMLTLCPLYDCCHLREWWNLEAPACSSLAPACLYFDVYSSGSPICIAIIPCLWKM